MAASSREPWRRQPVEQAPRDRCTVESETSSAARRLPSAAEKIAVALGEGTFDGDAHAFLMAVYKNDRLPVELRMDAARAAIGYEKPRLAAVEAKIDGRMTLEQLVLSSIRQRSE